MKKGFTLIELMIVIAIIAIIAAIAIPGLLAAQRASNERNASASLKTLTTAEADFRSNDRDGNLVNDFWTGDVWALYAMIPITGGATAPTTGTTTDASTIIKLIEPAVAGADGASLNGSYYCISFAASIVNGSPKAGYIYRVFASQDDGAGATALANDTDGADFYDSVHDRSRFAFMACPDTLSAGKLIFIVNADNTIWKYNLPASYIMTFTAIAGTTNSTSSITGTGSTAFLDAAVVFPSSPGSIGCSKMD